MRLHAQQPELLDWGANGSGFPGGGSGTWDTSSSNWVIDGRTTYQAWPNNDADTYATFGGTAGAVTLQSGIVVNSLVFNTDGYIVNAGSGSLALKNSSTNFGANVTVSYTGQTAIINAPITGSSLAQLTLFGAGTLNLTGANTFTASGGISIQGDGALKISSATGSLDPSTNLFFGVTPGTAGSGGSGSFIYDNTGATGASAQSLASVSISAGDATIQTNRVAAQTVSLTFGSETRVPGAAANFVANGGVTGTDNLISITGHASGFIDQGSFFGGSAYAWYDSGGFVRGIKYGVDSGTITSAGGTSVASTAQVQVTGAITAQVTATFTTLNLSGGNNFAIGSSSTLTVNGILKSGNNSATISGGTIKPGSGKELIIRADQASDALTISSAIAANGANALIKSGAGTLTLSGSDALTGKTYVDGGILSVAALTSLPSGTVQIQGGALQYTGATASTTRVLNVGFGGGAIAVTQAATSLTLSGVATGANTGRATDALLKNGAGTLILSGNSDNSGLFVTVNAGILQMAKTSGIFKHAVSSLVINNGGTAQLAGTGGDQIYDNADVVVNSGGTLDFNGKSEGFDGLSGAGTVTNTAATTSTLTVGLNGNISANAMDAFAGRITDGVGKMALFKIASGTQSLAGASTYSGGTTIQGGTLLVANTTGSATGTGFVDVQSGTLGGTGTVGGPLTIESGAALAPSATTFAATAGINLMSGAQLVFNLGLDRVTDTGGLTLGNTINLTLTGFGAGTYDLIDYTGALTDNSANFSGWTVTGLPTGYTANFVVTSSALQVQVIPEANPGLLLALGAVGMGCRRPFRRLRA
ncbi:beta strand repeat-containing protein [Chthoniobacter flavus]|nr:autotransporter-associated beta strand repeat-containing protein [Chthoniobacter flavus]